jgi:bifunctional non-homologous end joining protein LigD
VQPDGTNWIVRTVSVSNLDKVFFPETGFTKGQLIDYYTKVAPVLLPHIQDRPLTMKRFPNGVDGKFFYEKHAPSHTPEWVRTVAVPTADGQGDVTYAVVGDLAALTWAANLATIELHVPLWRVGRRRTLPGPPDFVIFDLDPGEGTTIVECCAVAGLINDLLREKGLDCRAKTSGSKGLQLYAALSGRPTWEKSRALAHEMAMLLEQQHPDLVVANMRKALRHGKVLIDWSQNHPAKTTVAVYSVRGRSRPTVSTPVTWREVGECERTADPASLAFTTDDVLARIDKVGDIFDVTGATKGTKREDSPNAGGPSRR